MKWVEKLLNCGKKRIVVRFIGNMLLNCSRSVEQVFVHGSKFSDIHENRIFSFFWGSGNQDNLMIIFSLAQKN